MLSEYPKFLSNKAATTFSRKRIWKACHAKQGIGGVTGI